jgi:hypothetical protein
MKNQTWHKLLLAGALLTGMIVYSADPANRFQSNNPRFHLEHGLLFFKARPFTGLQVARFENGDIYKEASYVDGLLEGVTKQYALHGVLRELWRYHRGVKDGLQEGWFAEGPKRFEFQFKAGVLEGLQKEWHLNGNIFRMRSYSDGVETQKKILYPGSEVFTNFVKKEGRIFGVDGGALCLEVKAEGSKSD